MSAITIFGTIQLLLFGVFGEYLGRVYEQVKQRPLYIIQEIVRTNGRENAVPDTFDGSVRGHKNQSVPCSPEK
jgi:hypothetical protein